MSGSGQYVTFVKCSWFYTGPLQGGKTKLRVAWIFHSVFSSKTITRTAATVYWWRKGLGLSKEKKEFISNPIQAARQTSPLEEIILYCINWNFTTVWAIHTLEGMKSCGHSIQEHQTSSPSKNTCDLEFYIVFSQFFFKEKPLTWREVKCVWYAKLERSRRIFCQEKKTFKSK